MVRGLWVGLLLLLGCERPLLRATTGELELSSAALHFEPTYLGFSRQLALVLRNGSRGDRRLVLSTTAPFASPAQLLVPGGASPEVQVTFTPTEAGLAAGKLSLSDGEQTFEVALDGAGLKPRTCAASALCRRSVFDPATGTCLESAEPDGVPCSSVLACTVDGVCSKGECRGNSPACSDDDACSLDSCQPGGGCVHQPRSCAAPADPCKVASCDPLRGCVESDAADGTACGPADCVTAQVCLLGACKPLPVPDGAACGQPSPCQAAGVCRQRACELPAPGPLKEAWNHPFAGEHDFRGIADAAQNLYWLECSPDLPVACAGCLRCEAVSFTRGGVERFRTDVGPKSSGGASMIHLLAKDRLVFVANGRVGAISAATGAPLWSSPLNAALQAAPELANVQLVQSMTADNAGNVYLLVRRYENTPSSAFPRHNAVVKLDSATGASRFALFFDGELTAAVMDEQDHLFFGLYPRSTSGPVAPAELRSLDSAGAERWRVIPGAPASVAPLAVFAGQLVLSGGRVASTLDGASVFPAPPEGQQRNALMSRLARTFLRPMNLTKPSPQPAASVYAFALPVRSAALAWDAFVAEGSSWYGLVSDAVGSATGEVLVAGAQPLGRTRLIALSSTGSTRFSCEIAAAPQPGVAVRFDSAVALLEGRWAAVERAECYVCDQENDASRLRVFDVPGQRPAAHGWAGSFGSPSGDSRPVP